MKLKKLSAVLAVLMALTAFTCIFTSATTTAAADDTAAYKVGDEFVAFIKADDTDYVSTGTGSTWEVASVDGAMGGKAIHCIKKSSTTAGDGVTLNFVVPADGEYVVWARAYYANQNSNSLFYGVDGETKSNIWDYPDEDNDAEPDKADCYGNWHYFYLTERAAGTYSDTTIYGSWTIEKGEWRHSPKTLNLTAGQHSIKITGREAGMYIDEFVISSYTVDEYNPNECTDNIDLLATCKFCGTRWKHYFHDVFAKTGTSAKDYFVQKNSTAVKWDIPAITTAATTTAATTTATTKATTTAVYETEATTTTAAAADVNVNVGCGSSIGAGAMLVAAATATVTVLVKKKKDE